MKTKEHFSYLEPMQANILPNSCSGADQQLMVNDNSGHEQYNKQKFLLFIIKDCLKEIYYTYRQFRRQLHMYIQIITITGRDNFLGKKSLLLQSP